MLSRSLTLTVFTVVCTVRTKAFLLRSKQKNLLSEYEQPLVSLCVLRMHKTSCTGRNQTQTKYRKTVCAMCCFLFSACSPLSTLADLSIPFGFYSAGKRKMASAVPEWPPLFPARLSRFILLDGKPYLTLRLELLRCKTALTHDLLLFLPLFQCCTYFASHRRPSHSSKTGLTFVEFIATSHWKKYVTCTQGFKCTKKGCKDFKRKDLVVLIQLQVFMPSTRVTESGEIRTNLKLSLVLSVPFQKTWKGQKIVSSRTLGGGSETVSKQEINLRLSRIFRWILRGLSVPL